MRLGGTVCREDLNRWEGALDFSQVLQIIDRHLPKDAPVLLEHMQTFAEYQRAYQYVADAAQKAGVPI